MARTITLDGASLTPEEVYAIGYEAGVRVEIDQEALERVGKARQVVEGVVARDETVYGINTGFGEFSKVRIGNKDVDQLQVNLIRSHAAGVGELLSQERTRMLLALRINVLAKGHSGISLENIKRMVAALNSNCVSAVPIKGTVGASGDLAPLSHLALGLMGEGKMYDPKGRVREAADVLKEHRLDRIVLHAKEGLALINGTQFITSLGCEALIRAEQLALEADVVAALTLEALKGTQKAYHPQIHKARAHRGQGQVAARLRAVLHRPGNESTLYKGHHDCGKVQDSYTLRCIPQVHGIVHDTLRFVRSVLEVECNSATDNPMIFSSFVPYEECGTDTDFEGSRQQGIISGGNFHGEYPAKVLDYLAIAVHELSNISERRIERLVNPALSQLPAFIVPDGGLNSGFMIAHCTAAALVSENKVLCHPASVDTLSTSAAQEDHVSMGGFAARKALQVVENVERVIGIELLSAAQAMEFHRPLETTPALESLVRLVRKKVPWMKEDRFIAPDMDYCTDLVRSGRIWESVKVSIEPQLHS